MIQMTVKFPVADTVSMVANKKIQNISIKFKGDNALVVLTTSVLRVDSVAKYSKE